MNNELRGTMKSMNEKEFQSVMRASGLENFRYFQSIGSTNQIATEWLHDGAPDRAVVFADHQSAGRGRLDRRWVTKPDSAIAVSIILRPEPGEKKQIAQFSPLAGVALAETLQEHYDITAEIKWPNDLLIQKKKVAGILTESVWDADNPTGIVVGVGVNIFQGSLPANTELQFPATWLQFHCEKPIDRYTFLGQFLNSFFNWRAYLGSQIFMNRWQELLAFRGENVYIKGNDGSTRCEGILTGINANGDLSIKTKSGNIEFISAGDVHLRPSVENHQVKSSTEDMEVGAC